MRGFMLSLFFHVPINAALWFYLDDLLILCGQDPQASQHALTWYRFYVWSLPFYSLYQIIWKFLSSQNVMAPLFYVCLFCCLIILPVSLEVFVEMFGYVGSAVAFTTFHASQTILISLYLWWFQPHHPSTWTRFLWDNALKASRVREYLRLGAGGILAQTEWVYWEAVGLIVGTLGVTELSAHTIANQVMMIMLSTSYGVGVALSIRMGAILPFNVKKAKYLVTGTVFVVTIFLGLGSILLYISQDLIFSCFTRDAEVAMMSKSIWWRVCTYNFIVSIFAVLIVVCSGLAEQWTLGILNFVLLLCFSIPSIYYSFVMNGGGGIAAWTWMNVPYIFINLLLLITFSIKDWHAFSNQIREREGISDTKIEEDVSQKCYGTMRECQHLINSSSDP